MGLSTAVGIAGSVVSGIAGMKGGKEARKAAAASQAYTQQQVAQARQDTKKWRTAGGDAVNKLRGLLTGGQDVSEDFKAEDPGYKFAVEQGEKALYNRQSAGPGIYSGRSLKEVSRFNQELATGVYQNYIRNLMGLSGQGLDASRITAQVGMQGAGQYGRAAGMMQDAAYSQYGSLGNMATGVAGNVITGMQRKAMQNTIGRDYYPAGGYGQPYVS